MIHPRVDAAAYTLATLVKPLNTVPVALQKTVLAAPHTTVLVTFLYGGCSMRASSISEDSEQNSCCLEQRLRLTLPLMKVASFIHVLLPYLLGVSGDLFEGGGRSIVFNESVTVWNANSTPTISLAQLHSKQAY